MQQQTPVEIVIQLFGIRPMARDLGIVPSTVLRWRKTGLVPAEHHKALVEMSGGQLTAEDLVFGRK